MPGRSRRLDPVTGDYRRNDAGNGFAMTTSVETIVYHVIRGQRGRWFGDPDHGCHLYLVREHGLDREGLLFAANAVKAGLTPLVRDGLIKDVSVEVAANEFGLLELLIKITDISGGVIDASGLTPFGGGDGSAL
jgi:phage gp46-like protein